MAEGAAAYPAVVQDRWGNLWRRYPDVGYVRLITQSRRMESAARDLTALRERTGGPLVEWVPTDG